MDYWLALWWGSARWIAHIWVLKYLKEKNINITEISWTSMWALIWGLFAMWKDYEEIENILKTIDFKKLIDLNLKDAIVSGNKIYNKLFEIYWDITFEELKIPFSVVATDFKTWEKIVFKSWKLIDALRASISLPWIFKPYEINHTKYIDWWLKSNLPVLELSKKNIIAVSVISWEIEHKTHREFLNFKIQKWFLWNTYDTIKKTIWIMMKTNEDLNILLAKNLEKNVILIAPALAKYEYFDFYKIDEILKIGYLEAKKILKDI